MDSCAACFFMHKQCNPDCEMRQCFPMEGLGNFELLTNNFGDPENVVRMVKDIKNPDERLDFIKSLEFETYCRIADPIHGSLGLISLELEMSKLLKKKLEYLKNIRDIVAANKHKGQLK